ncbi:hypothetical protein BMS67_04665 [Leuconostoc mesenteroides subsp. cremoris]|nr:hypothetical protein BMS67_04665 [Leuconostoc mesenteroides subsp. cremoris]
MAPFFYPIIFARSAIGNNTLPIILTRINPTIISNKALNNTMLISQAKIGSRIFGVGKYFHSKSTRPFLITKKGI